MSSELINILKEMQNGEFVSLNKSDSLERQQQFNLLLSKGLIEPHGTKGFSYHITQNGLQALKLGSIKKALRRKEGKRPLLEILSWVFGIIGVLIVIYEFIIKTH